MKRALIPLVALLFALAGVGVVASAAYYPSTNVGSTANTASTAKGQTPQKLTGYAGKIIAVKPPGDWAKGGGPADTTRPPLQRLPLTLPVFGTDVHVAAVTETFIASNPANPLYFIAGSNAVARAFSSDGGLTWAVTAPSGIGDPMGTYDDAGNAYWGQLSTGSCPDPAVVARSSNGGQTWGSPGD